MGKSSFVKVLCTIVVSLALGLTTEPLLAQRGGHGGGGGFHGGVGGFHGGGGGGFHGGGGYGGFHGGGGDGGFHGGTTGFRGAVHGPSYGGYRGSGYYGGRGYGWGYGGGRGYGWGYPGWRGGWGGWGYPGFGWGGWGISIGFNFGPFWGGYAYPYYAYSPWWYAPAPAQPCYYYPSPCYVPSAYAPADPGSYRVSNEDYPDNSQPEYSNTEYSNPESPSYVGPSSQQLAETAIRQVPESRPEVRNAIRALSGMPPAARERELATGLYADFSPQERQLVKAAVFTPAPNTNARTVERTALQAPEQHRREVRNAIRTLQAMPPAARQRQIDSGAYSSFSPSERQMLKTVSAVQTSARIAQPGM